MSTLTPVIKLDHEKCANCVKCVSACPVKRCHVVSTDSVDIDPDLSIGCGACIESCSHEARSGIDDFGAFMAALKSHKPMVAIAAPAVAAEFPGQELRINGWLRSLAVEAIFDVSFNDNEARGHNPFFMHRPAHYSGDGARISCNLIYFGRWHL